MANDESELLLQEIAQTLSEDTEYPLDGTLVYARVGHWFSAPSIFKDVGDHVLYRDEKWGDVANILLELWESQDTDDRWSEMEYVVRDGRFDVTFVYPDEIDPGEDEFVRRDGIVAKHFGDKPIVYPPDEPDEDGFVL